MLTETDRKVLKLLYQNGRASYSDIAQKLGITPSTAAKRIKYLLDSHTISVRGMPNPYKLGLTAGAYINLEVAPEKLADISTALNHELFTSTVLTTLGRFNMVCITHAPSWKQLNSFITNNLASLEGILDYDCRYIDTIIKHFQAFGEKRFFETSPNLKKTDWKIIHHLCRDGRQSNSEIAESLDIHVSTVSRRIQYLLQQEYIQVRPQPNPAMLDYASSAIITAKLEKENADKIYKVIARAREVFFLVSLITQPQIVFGIHTESNDQISSLLNQFLALPGVERSEVLLKSKVIKSNYW